MISLKNGRYIFPERLFYDKEQHVYLDLANKTMGLDQLGHFIVGKVKSVQFLSSGEVGIGDPIVRLVSEKKAIVIQSPCSGIIEELNREFDQYAEYDTYTKGYLIKLSKIVSADSNLIKGGKV